MSKAVNCEIRILDEFGELLETYRVPSGLEQFESADLEGVALMGAQLQDANFRNADLYWAILFTANLNRANFEGAVLCGADLKEASCVGTNFKNANLGKDKLGGPTKLQMADLSDAILDGAIFDGALYDGKTKFPNGFQPWRHGMVRRDI